MHFFLASVLLEVARTLGVLVINVNYTSFSLALTPVNLWLNYYGKLIVTICDIQSLTLPLSIAS
ncbi:hypothetical protein [[Phormidium] sp. LEGE 05292]|uniref:hypothetical protein n=1 Tax=[Phormidium] sp. LEGE 05292 TaxID=767427 RepID=UPI0018801585|nr:hypothetical protein [Phormidium sp. LEGE 05292]